MTSLQRHISDKKTLCYRNRTGAPDGSAKPPRSRNGTANRIKRTADESPDASPKAARKSRRGTNGLKKQAGNSRFDQAEAKEEIPSGKSPSHRSDHLFSASVLADSWAEDNLGTSFSHLVSFPGCTDIQPRLTIADAEEELDQGPEIMVDDATSQCFPPPMVPSQTIQQRRLLPPFQYGQQKNRPVSRASTPGDAVNGIGISNVAFGRGSSHAPLAMPASTSMRPSAGSENFAVMHEMLRRQQETVRRMALTSQYRGGYNAGLQPSISGLRSSLNMEQNGLPTYQSQILGNGDGYANDGISSSFQAHQDRSLDYVDATGHPMLGLSVPHSQDASRRSSLAGIENFGGDNLMLPHLSALDSRNPSRHSSVAPGQPLAPGSRVQSRQPSIDRVSSRRSSVFQHTGVQSHEAEPSRLLVKLPIPRELKLDVSTIRPACYHTQISNNA